MKIRIQSNAVSDQCSLWIFTTNTFVKDDNVDNSDWLGNRSDDYKQWPTWMQDFYRWANGDSSLPPTLPTKL